MSVKGSDGIRRGSCNLLCNFVLLGFGNEIKELYNQALLRIGVHKNLLVIRDLSDLTAVQ